MDCGLFQGAETSPGGAGAGGQEIEFPVGHLRALVLTHVHLDHAGRIPYLLAAGFRGPILCSEPTALLLPLLLEDALKIGFTRDRRLIERVLAYLKGLLVPLPYGRWHPVALDRGAQVRIKLKPAGHILGSAYVECDVGGARVVFSGDLGAPYAPLLPAPRPPYRADVLVLESTYGDRDHEGRRERRAALAAVLARALRNRGTVVIPAFSIGRTQEILYELEAVLHRRGGEALGIRGARSGDPLRWEDLEILVDSPLASRFTAAYRRLRPFWDAEARRRVRAGRHPLSFEQLTTVGSHREHLRTVETLARSGRPAVVLAGSGMCTGGRVVSYLRALLEDPRHDVLFVGYQARGTPGRAIQTYGPRGGYVDLDGRRLTIRAGVHTLSGYSAHAGRRDLVHFVRRMRHPPQEIRLVHGDREAKRALAAELTALGLGAAVRG
ncbi:MAG: MBL fold metallo-hydrolase [Deferrisomatales bacterium]